MNKYQLSIIIALFVSTTIFAQSTNVPLNMESYHMVDRLEIMSGEVHPDIFTTNKSLQRKDVAAMAEHIDSLGINMTGIDRANIYYLFKEHSEWLQERESILSKKPIFKHLYKSPANFYELDTKFFDLKINPVLNIQMGRDTNNEDGEMKYENTRGLELRGSLDDKVGFYAYVADNQAKYPDYIQARIARDKGVPGAGYYKTFKTTGVDFWEARGYISANVTKHLNIQFGHDKNFIGNGYRSLLLSDEGANYFFLKLTAQVWKINYQTIFAELAGDYRALPGDNLIGKKYASFHHLSFKAGKRLSLGFFEAIIFDRSKFFELQYLNPLIFYATIEQMVGSPDNAILGFDVKYNFAKKFSLYGQLVLDELKFDELRARNGWWANKFGVQVGAKYIDVLGVRNLDMQVEYNGLRPYTFTHNDKYNNYSHFNQALAHPSGANFHEFLAIIRYQPHRKVFIYTKGGIIQQGIDSLSISSNVGSNIFISNNDVRNTNPYNNSWGQGLSQTMLSGDLRVSYMFKHNLNFDLSYHLRKVNNELDALDNTSHYLSAGIRLNFAPKKLDF